MGDEPGHETRLHAMPASTSRETLKQHHAEFPCHVLENGTIIVSTIVKHGMLVSEFIASIAEPVSRPQYVHEYKLTSFSLLSAISDAGEGEEAGRILKMLQTVTKHTIPKSVCDFIQFCESTYCKVGITYSGNGVFLTSRDPSILNRLRRSEKIRMAMVLQDHAGDLPSTGKRGKYAQLDGGEGWEDGEEDSVPDPHVYLKINPRRIGVVKEEAAKMDLPIIEEYDYLSDDSLPRLSFCMHSDAKLRWYQEKALSMMFRSSRAKSGVIVLPCGAGKTLTGISAACTIGKSTLVICNNTLACHQWAAAFKQFTSATDDDIYCFISGTAPELPENSAHRAFVLMATYSMMSMNEDSRSEKSSEFMGKIVGIEWGMLILDEVHIAPAKKFREAIHMVRSRCKMGLTATMVREDDQIGDLNYLVGPKIFEANWMQLTSQGYLARVMCYEVQCPMSVTSMIEYAKNHKEKDEQVFYYSSNTNKIGACKRIMDHHESLGHQTLIFGDSIPILIYCARTFPRHMMYGETPEHERLDLFARFRSGEIKTLLISRVGDVAVDLPDANVIIQISAHFASRRQETQRLGRILRPKGNTVGPDGSPVYNAFFYSLVSPLTKEAMYNVSRQKYLNDQGFTYSTVSWELLMGHKGDAHTREEQAEILKTIRDKKKNKLDVPLEKNPEDDGSGGGGPENFETLENQ